MAWKRITKKQAFKRFTEHKTIYLVPCKFYPGGVWNVECLITLTDDLIDSAKRYEQYFKEQDTSFYAKQYAHLWSGSIEKTAWNLMYNNWSYYNTSYEQGYYAHYYILVK